MIHLVYPGIDGYDLALKRSRDRGVNHAPGRVRRQSFQFQNL